MAQSARSSTSTKSDDLESATITSVEEGDDDVGMTESAKLPTIQVQSLVAGRERRSTAGNRLAHLLDKEVNKDDELELLFAEAEDDVEFEVEDDENLQDVDLGSSDDDEDDKTGQNWDGAAEEDLSGEVELQQQVKADRATKKRKAHEAFQFKQPRVPTKKKVTIVEGESAEPTMDASGKLLPSEAVLNKHRKKSERISWIPTEGALRASSRRLALENRAVTHQRLKESEARRLHTIALMEAAAKKKQKEHPKREMTQAERLEEAKRTERMNMRSLNKWEEAEANRQEQQRLKLAALHNRTLEGPVIRWWSGRAEWGEHGRIIGLGKIVDLDKGKSRKEQDGTDKLKIASGKLKPKTTVDVSTDGADKSEDTRKIGASPVSNEAPSTSIHPQDTTPSETTIRVVPQDSSKNIVQISQRTPPATGGMDEIRYYASLYPGASDSVTTHLSGQATAMANCEEQSRIDTSEHILEAEPSAFQVKREPEYSTRNLVMLQNYEAYQVQTRDAVARSLWPNRSARKEKPVQEICYMTSELARFRDPRTGVAYANLWAYKQLQRIRTGKIRWSGVLEAYVGPLQEAAAGVPPGFLDEMYEGSTKAGANPNGSV